jgi:hypothetical protein
LAGYSTVLLTQPEVTFLNDKMLCNTCSEVFAFGQTDSILQLKEGVIAQAIIQNFNNSKVENLQKEYGRYQLARKLSNNTQEQVPSPWEAIISFMGW